MQQKQAPDLFIILVNNPESSESLKNGNFIFSFEPSPFQQTKLSKQKGSRTSDQLLFRLQNKFGKIPLLVMYYLTKFDGVI